MRGGEETHHPLCINASAEGLNSMMSWMLGTLGVTSDKRTHKELEQRLTVIQTSLNGVETSISKFENLIEECRMVEEEVHQIEEEEAHQDQSNSGEEATDIDMADQEESGHLESSDPHMEANTEDNPPLASGGNTISLEEEEILFGGSLQSEDHSPGSETASVLGGMAKLHLSSPTCSGPEEEETPQ